MFTHFLTFGGGPSNFHDAAKRVSKEAIKSGIFSTVHCYLDKDLEKMSDFWLAHGHFIKNNKRLYGYCIWKPYLVLKILETMKEGDRLFYADSGCQFDFDCEDPKSQYETMLGHMGDQIMSATYCNIDHNMTKRDLVVHLNMEDHPRLKSGQIQTTTFLLTKCERIMNFVRLWYSMCCNYHFIDDTPSIIPNHSNYDEHRHEQSVFSLLAKKLDIYNPGDKYNNCTIENVICLIRNRTGATYPCCRVTGSPFFNFNEGGDEVNPTELKEYIKKIQKYQPEKVIQYGFGSGRSASAMLLMNSKLKEMIICSESYETSQYQNYFSAMVPLIKFYTGTPAKVMKDLKTDKIDLSGYVEIVYKSPQSSKGLNR
jgi:hypothetical protein